MAGPHSDKDKDKDKDKYSFFVDASEYKTDSKSLTGAEIREMAHVTPTYQLFLEEPGDDPDRPVANDETIEMKKGKNARRFYTVPPATFGDYENK